MKTKNYYQRRKQETIDEAIEWQHQAAKENYSYGELDLFYRYFSELAKRYGLIKEFKENGII